MTTTLLYYTATEAANNGVNLLDDQRPDWRPRVNFDSDHFDMSDWNRCVLGQLGESEYTVYLYALMADAKAAGYEHTDDGFDFAMHYGFDHWNQYIDGTFTYEKTRAMEDAWRAAL